MTADELQAHIKSGRPFNFNDLGDMPLSDYVKEHMSLRAPAPMIICMDGFKMSVQASASHYCSPRNNDGPYSHFEVGFPSQRDSLLEKYGERIDDPENPDKVYDDVYPMVPLIVVLAVISSHGGAASPNP